MNRTIGALALALSTTLAACGSEPEQLSPLTTSAPPIDAGVDAEPPPPPPPPPMVDGGVVKRTVMTRNPFGASVGNHLVDGDFEMSTTYYQGQFGWRAFTADGTGEIAMATETGGLCRSGLRCAVLQPKSLMLVRGAAAKGKGNIASAWAKVSGDVSCSKVRPMLIECDAYQVVKQLSLDGSKDGWCHYALAVGERQSALCLYVENSLPDGATALLDSFFIGPDDGTAHPLSSEVWAPPAETLTRLQNVRARVIATTPFDKPPRPRAPSP